MRGASGVGDERNSVAMMMSVPMARYPVMGLRSLGCVNCLEYDDTGGCATCGDSTTPVDTGNTTTTTDLNACNPATGYDGYGVPCAGTPSAITGGSGPNGALIPGDPGYAAALASQCAAQGGSVAPNGAGCSFSSDVTCNAAGGMWSGGKCSTPNVSIAPAATGATGFLNALAQNTPTIVRAITGQTVTSAQCVSAGGTFNASTGACTPGLSSYLPLLLVAGVGIVLLSSLGKGR